MNNPYIKVSMVVAVADNGVIGSNGKLPWHLPNDLEHFKRLTMFKPVIMGRKTFESIGKKLPGRCNIVVTRDPNWHHEDVEVARSLKQAIAYAEDYIGARMMGEIMIVGGSEVYKQALEIVDRIYLTRVNAEIEGDTYFDPELSDDWKVVSLVECARDEKNAHDHTFVELCRSIKY